MNPNGNICFPILLGQDFDVTSKYVYNQDWNQVKKNLQNEINLFEIVVLYLAILFILFSLLEPSIHIFGFAQKVYILIFIKHLIPTQIFCNIPNHNIMVVISLL